MSALLMATLSMSAQGNQKIIYEDGFGDKDYSLYATHPDFSMNGEVQLFQRSDHSETTSVSFYDDNFEKQRDLTLPSVKVDFYTTRSEAAVTGYNVETKDDDYVRTVYNAEYDHYYYYDYDAQTSVEVSGPMSVEQARHFIAERNGSEILNEVTTNEGTFFYVAYFFLDDLGGAVTRSPMQKSQRAQSTDYPYRWFWLTTDGSLKFVERNYQVVPVVGDYVEGEKEYYSTMSEGISYVRFVDYDAPYDMESSVLLTQTLFNDDAKFEYIRPLVTDGLSYVGRGSQTRYIDAMGISVEVPFIAKTYGNRMSGFQVMSEDGTVLQTVQFDGNFVMRSYTSASLLRIHGKLYLAFEGYVLDVANSNMRQASLVYAFDRQSSQVRKVMEQVGDVVVTPRVADRSEQITVELNDEGGIREIQVLNGNGQTEVRVPVAKGQKRVTIPASQLSRGLNVVNAVGGKHRQAHKVMVK